MGTNESNNNINFLQYINIESKQKKCGPATVVCCNRNKKILEPCEPVASALSVA